MSRIWCNLILAPTRTTNNWSRGRATVMRKVCSKGAFVIAASGTILLYWWWLESRLCIDWLNMDEGLPEEDEVSVPCGAAGPSTGNKGRNIHWHHLLICPWHSWTGEIENILWKVCFSVSLLSDGYANWPRPLTIFGSLPQQPVYRREATFHGAGHGVLINPVCSARKRRGAQSLRVVGMFILVVYLI